MKKYFFISSIFLLDLNSHHSYLRPLHIIDMFNLPIELQRLIFEFDPTFLYIQWNKVIAQVKKKWEELPTLF